MCETQWSLDVLSTKRAPSVMRGIGRRLPPKAPPTWRVLSIGLSAFLVDGGVTKSIPGAANDALRFAMLYKQLQNDAIVETIVSSTESIHSDTYPTKKKILDALNRVSSDSSSAIESTLIVYIATHGQRTPNNLWLASCETDGSISRLHPRENGYFSLKKVVQIMNGSSAHYKILILDVCYAGQALHDLSILENVSVICSCTSGQTALEIDSEDPERSARGLFSYILTETIQDYASRGLRFSLSDISEFERMAKLVDIKAGSGPYSRRQTPLLSLSKTNHPKICLFPQIRPLLKEIPCSSASPAISPISHMAINAPSEEFSYITGEIPNSCELFVQRTIKIQELDQVFTQHSGPFKRVAIVGIAGSGKTELANAYGRLYCSRTPPPLFVWWFRADHPHSFMLGLEALLVDLDVQLNQYLPPGHLHLSFNDGYIHYLKRKLRNKLLHLQSQNMHCSPPLFIFDAIKSMADEQLIRLLDTGLSGLAIYTSRHARMGDDIPSISLNQGFTDFEAIIFVKQFIESTSEQINELVNYLDRLPLALQVACRYIRRQSIDIPSYLSMVRHHSRSIELTQTRFCKRSGFLPVVGDPTLPTQYAAVDFAIGSLSVPGRYLLAYCSAFPAHSDLPQVLLSDFMLYLAILQFAECEHIVKKMQTRILNEVFLNSDFNISNFELSFGLSPSSVEKLQTIIFDDHLIYLEGLQQAGLIFPSSHVFLPLNREHKMPLVTWRIHNITRRCIVSDFLKENFHGPLAFEIVYFLNIFVVKAARSKELGKAMLPLIQAIADFSALTSLTSNTQSTFLKSWAKLMQNHHFYKESWSWLLKALKIQSMACFQQLEWSHPFLSPSSSTDEVESHSIMSHIACEISECSFDPQFIQIIHQTATYLLRYATISPSNLSLNRKMRKLASTYFFLGRTYYSMHDSLIALEFYSISSRIQKWAIDSDQEAPTINVLSDLAETFLHIALIHGKWGCVSQAYQIATLASTTASPEAFQHQAYIARYSANLAGLLPEPILKCQQLERTLHYLEQRAKIHLTSSDTSPYSTRFAHFIYYSSRPSNNDVLAASCYSDLGEHERVDEMVNLLDIPLKLNAFSSSILASCHRDDLDSWKAMRMQTIENEITELRNLDSDDRESLLHLLISKSLLQHDRNGDTMAEYLSQISTVHLDTALLILTSFQFLRKSNSLVLLSIAFLERYLDTHMICSPFRLVILFHLAQSYYLLRDQERGNRFIDEFVDIWRMLFRESLPLPLTVVLFLPNNPLSRDLQCHYMSDLIRQNLDTYGQPSNPLELLCHFACILADLNKPNCSLQVHACILRRLQRMPSKAVKLVYSESDPGFTIPRFVEFALLHLLIHTLECELRDIINKCRRLQTISFALLFLNFSDLFALGTVLPLFPFMLHRLGTELGNIGGSIAYLLGFGVIVQLLIRTLRYSFAILRVPEPFSLLLSSVSIFFSMLLLGAASSQWHLFLAVFCFAMLYDSCPSASTDDSARFFHLLAKMIGFSLGSIFSACASLIRIPLPLFDAYPDLPALWGASLLSVSSCLFFTIRLLLKQSAENTMCDITNLTTEEELVSPINEQYEEKSIHSPVIEGHASDGDLVLALLVHVNLIAVLFATGAFLPIWMTLPIRFGGLAFSPFEVGSFWCFAGLIGFLFQILIIPPILKRLGPVRLIQGSLLLFMIFLALPRVCPGCLFDTSLYLTQFCLWGFLSACGLGLGIGMSSFFYSISTFFHLASNPQKRSQIEWVHGFFAMFLILTVSCPIIIYLQEWNNSYSSSKYDSFSPRVEILSYLIAPALFFSFLLPHLGTSRPRHLVTEPISNQYSRRLSHLSFFQWRFPIPRPFKCLEWCRKISIDTFNSVLVGTSSKTIDSSSEMNTLPSNVRSLIDLLSFEDDELDIPLEPV